MKRFRNFRGKMLANFGRYLKKGDWVEGDYHEVLDGETYCFITGDNGIDLLVDPRTVGESVGISVPWKDHDYELPEELYDGDIIEVAGVMEKNRFLISMDDEMPLVYIENLGMDRKFRGKSVMTRDWVKDFKDSLRLLGNKFDNPELLK